MIVCKLFIAMEQRGAKTVAVQKMQSELWAKRLLVMENSVCVVCVITLTARGGRRTSLTAKSKTQRIARQSIYFPLEAVSVTLCSVASNKMSAATDDVIKEKLAKKTKHQHHINYCLASSKSCQRRFHFVPSGKFLFFFSFHICGWISLSVSRLLEGLSTSWTERSNKTINRRKSSADQKWANWVRRVDPQSELSLNTWSEGRIKHNYTWWLFPFLCLFLEGRCSRFIEGKAKKKSMTPTQQRPSWWLKGFGGNKPWKFPSSFVPVCPGHIWSHNKKFLIPGVCQTPFPSLLLLFQPFWPWQR